MKNMIDFSSRNKAIVLLDRVYDRNQGASPVDPYYAAGYPAGHPGAADPYQNYDPYQKQYASRSRDSDFALSTSQNPPARFVRHRSVSINQRLLSLIAIMILIHCIVPIRMDQRMVKHHLGMRCPLPIHRSRQVILPRTSSDHHRPTEIHLLHLTRLRSPNTMVLNSEPKISLSGHGTNSF